ncbi:MAG: hypothetical protein ACI9C4_003271 [Paraglaciecola sp.]
MPPSLASEGEATELVKVIHPSPELACDHPQEQNAKRNGHNRFYNPEKQYRAQLKPTLFERRTFDVRRQSLAQIFQVGF